MEDQVQQERLRRFVDEWREEVWKIGAEHPEECTDPVSIAVKFHDSGVPLSQLINTENATLNKLLTVLSFDCVEISKLKREAHKKIYPRLLVFGQMAKEGDAELGFAKSYTFFHELRVYILSLRGLLSNLVRQLQGFYSPASRKKQVLYSFSAAHLYTAFNSLADGLAILMTVDEIVAHNGAIGHGMTSFTRMLQSVRSDPDMFGMKPDQIESLDQSIAQMDDLLLTGLFQRCLQEDFSLNVEKEKLTFFLEEMSFCVRSSMSKLLARIDTSRELPDDREQLTGLLGTFLLYSWMSGETNDKKTLKIVLKAIAALPVLHPVTNARILSMEFVVGHSPPWVRSSQLWKDVRKDFETAKSTHLAALDEALVRDYSNTQRAIARWLISFSSFSYSPHDSNSSVLDAQLRQITTGVLLANRLQRIVRSVVDLHVILEIPISKDQVRHCRYSMVLLKAIQELYRKVEHELAQSLVQLTGHLRIVLQGALMRLKSQLEADLNSKSKSSMTLFNRSPSTARELDTKLLDALSCVDVALKANEHLFEGRCTFQLALELVAGLQNKLQDDLEGLMDYSMLTDLAVNLRSLVDLVTDCSFLYWNKPMMTTCFSMAYSEGSEARHTQCLVSAFLDGAKLLQAGSAEPHVVSFYERMIHNCLISEVVKPLCHDVETDLRLHVHSAHLKGAVTVDPTKTGIRDLSWFLKIKPLRLISKCVDIKARVEMHLNAAFYDHAAVSLHNWKTYNEMKILAEQKYGLVLEAIHLPGQTLEQGVDVLEIMRNIHIFVACYTYNLNTQMFIEKPSNARSRKHLNTVSVKHVANSIRTHGTGIMSTTVNFAYQFLAQKFVVFSQFLFDDHIKSRLVKEQRFYTENKLRPESGYPVERAEKLNKDIRKLGLTDDGLSFLDQFRCLISEMGNTLGFVRMVRLGGLHYCTTACGSLSELNFDNTFEEAAKALHVPSPAVDAGGILDRALSSQNLSVEETNYFSILKNVFQHELRGNGSLHLRDFFLLVPALTTNAAEAMYQAKERLHKRGRDAMTAMFTDDGFSLGVAYILKVLDQDKQFDSLHWFQSAKSHLVSERSRLEEGLDLDSIESGMNGLQAWSQKVASLSKEEAQNMQMAMKRLTSMLTEVELVEFTLTGARVFFH